MQARNVYRLRRVSVVAVQLCWKNWSDICDLFDGLVNKANPARYSSNTEIPSDACGEVSPYISLGVPCLCGTVTARHGDWIVRGGSGPRDYEVLRPDYFDQVYERVNAPAAAHAAEGGHVA